MSAETSDEYPVKADFEVPKLQRNTLNEVVYQQLKEALMSGRIAPGKTLTIRSLAKSFGVSLMPVREALRQLVAEHVLTMLPNRSVTLPVITPERFREITRIRVALEGLAAEEATPLLSEAEIVQLDSLNAEMEGIQGASSPEYLVRNREFHFTVYRAAGMPTLLSTIESLWVRVGPLLNVQQEAIASMKTNIIMAHHRSLLRALRQRNPDAARAAIAADIEDAAQIILQKVI